MHSVSFMLHASRISRMVLRRREQHPPVNDEPRRTMIELLITDGGARQGVDWQQIRSTNVE